MKKSDAPPDQSPAEGGRPTAEGKTKNFSASSPLPSAFNAACTLDSAELFGEKKLVLIRHNEDWYKLMITKKNKLILMK